MDVEILQGTTGAEWEAQLIDGRWVIWVGDELLLPGIEKRLREILLTAPTDVREIVVRTGGSVYMRC